MSTTDWALSAATKFVEQERIKAEQWAKAINKRQTLVSQAPALWEQIRQALESQICCFNERVGRQVLTTPTDASGKLAIYAQTETGPRALIAEFDSYTPAVRCKIRNGGGPIESEDKYPIDLNLEKNLPVAVAAGVECDAEQVAGRLLSGLLGWN